MFLRILENEKKINFFFLLLCVYYFYFLLNTSTLFTFSSFGDLGLHSDDEIYLAEQLLFIINYDSKLILLNFENANYGSEFYLFKFIFFFLKFFLNISAKEILYILISIHFVIGFSTLFIIQQIFLSLQINRFLIYLIFPLMFIYDKKFIYTFSSLKPDSNVCLFLIFLSILFILKNISKKNILFFTIFSSLAFSIKLWGVFLFLPFIYLLQEKKIDLNFFFSRNEIKIISSIIFFLINVVLLVNINFITDHFNYGNNFFLKGLLLIIILDFFFIFFILKINLFFNFINNYFHNLIIFGLLFFFFYLLFSFPFLIDAKIFLSSIKYFVYDVPKYQYLLGGSFFSNILISLKFLFLFFKVNNSLIFIFLFFIFYTFLKKNFTLLSKFILLIIVQIFLFFVFYGRINSGIYILTTLILVLFIYQLSLHRKFFFNKFFFLLICLFFTFFFMNFKNFKYHYNIFNYPLINYSNQKNIIQQKVLLFLEEKFKYNKNVNILLCQQKLTTSFIQKKFNTKFLNKYDCANRNNFNNDSVFILTGDQFGNYNFDFFKKSKKITYEYFENFDIVKKHIYILYN